MTLQQALFDAQPVRTNDAGPAPWLIEQLIRSGTLTETGLSRRARPRPCARCHTWTVCGLDADTLALEAHCDPQPLTPLGEVIALATGRRTLELVRTRGRLELEQRWADHIESRLAGNTPGADVLATHRCGQPIAASYSTTSVHAPPTRTATAEEPGF